MMSGVPLETCWAFSKLWNNKFYYKVASCWLFLLSHTAMHGSMNIKKKINYYQCVCEVQTKHSNHKIVLSFGYSTSLNQHKWSVEFSNPGPLNVKTGHWTPTFMNFHKRRCVFLAVRQRHDIWRTYYVTLSKLEEIFRDVFSAAVYPMHCHYAKTPSREVCRETTFCFVVTTEPKAEFWHGRSEVSKTPSGLMLHTF